MHKTIHKTQGSTIDHMTGNLDTTTEGGKHLCPISQGLVYTLLSHPLEKLHGNKNFSE